MERALPYINASLARRRCVGGGGATAGLEESKHGSSSGSGKYVVGVAFLVRPCPSLARPLLPPFLPFPRLALGFGLGRCRLLSLPKLSLGSPPSTPPISPSLSLARNHTTTQAIAGIVAYFAVSGKNKNTEKIGVGGAVRVQPFLNTPGHTPGHTH